MADEGGKFTYFLAGIGLGALIGTLFAPHSGEETRDLVGRKTEEGREFLRRKREEARDRAEDLAERGRKIVARETENVRSAIDAGKQAYREASKG